MQIFGKARYDYLVNMCDEMGIITPEHPFPVWTERGRPGDHRADVPAVRLHLPAAGAPRPRPRGWPSPGNATWSAPTSSCCRPSPTPPATPGAATGCPLPASGSRTSTGWTPTVLVNHFPLVREPCDAMFYPEFALWCGTTATADWHTRYNAVCLGLRPPAHPAHHLVRRRAASKRCRSAIRESGGGAKPYRWLRRMLPDPKYAPGYLNEFGGHFQITQEMRDHAREGAGAHQGRDAVMTAAAAARRRAARYRHFGGGRNVRRSTGFGAAAGEKSH